MCVGGGRIGCECICVRRRVNVCMSVKRGL